MTAENVIGIAQAVISNREQLVTLRPVGKLLTVSVLNCVAEVKSPESFESDLHTGDVSAADVKLART